MNRLAGLSGMCWLLIGPFLQAEPPVNPPDELTKLKHERLAAAEAWHKATQTENFAVANNDTHRFREMLQAIRAKRDAKLNLATTKQERVAAREGAFKELEDVHQKIETLFKLGAKGGDPIHLYSTKYEMLDAKIKWLEEAQGN